MKDQGLEEEAALYGDAGLRPQVVWANGELASTAVGAILEILTSWTARNEITPFYSYDRNLGIVVADQRLELLGDLECEHYPLNQAGPPVFRGVQQVAIMCSSDSLKTRKALDM